MKYNQYCLMSGELRTGGDPTEKDPLARFVELTGKAGRPRLHYQVEQMEEELAQLGKLTQAFPTL